MKGLWARAVEVLLGLWLVASPLALPGAPAPLARVSGAAGILVVGTVVLSLPPSLRRVHLLTLPLSVVSIGWAWAAFDRPGPPAAQNLILVGLLLGLLAVVPSDAFSPPASWQPWVERDHRGPPPDRGEHPA